MDDQDFDRKARELHARATREMPQAVQQRLRGALATPRRSHHSWQPMVAFASMAVLAIGSLLAQHPMAPAADPPVATPPVNARVVATQGVPGTPVPEIQTATATTVTAAYDNDPEFYAWLGNDAPPVPKE